MTHRKLFAIPMLVLAAACGGGDPGGDGGGGTAPPTNTTPPSITSISPSPLLEGGTATIVGTNFSTTSGANLVRIDGEQAVVTGATATQLTVRVPRTCGAIRTGTVTVSVSSRTSPAVSVEIDPDAQSVNLAVGEQAIFKGLGTFCVALPAGDGAVQYLVGLQSTSENGGTKTGAVMKGAVSSTAALAPSGLPASRVVPSGGRALPAFPTDPGAGAYLRHRTDHGQQLQRDLAFVESLGLPPRAQAASDSEPARAIVTGSEQVGDRIDLRVLDHTAGGCDTFSTITAELKIKTAKAMWFVDVSNPQPGYSAPQLQSMADLFESDIRQADENMFGVPGDKDGNGRVAIVITERVNSNNGTQGGTVGFVNICDGFDRDGGPFPATNEGEFFYAVSPDEANEHGQKMSIDFLLDFMPLLLAHEYAHVIQFSRRFADQAGQATITVMDPFEAEGQGTLAEEIVGHSVLGNAPLQNYGGDLAWDFDDVLPFAWYGNPFSDLAFYYGANTATKSRVAGAPEECTWTQDQPSDPDPCLSRASWYGVTWSFFRWAADQIALEGGDAAALQKSIIDSRLDGFDNLRAAFASLGPLEDLLAEWAASLYTDERIAGAPNPRLTFPSWDLVDVGAQVASWTRLEPRARAFIGFTDNVTIRSPSMAYWLITGSANPAMTLSASSTTGGDLPDHIQMWVVRMN
jgi:IPT/TIG domain-containing protein